MSKSAKMRILTEGITKQYYQSRFGQTRARDEMIRLLDRGQDRQRQSGVIRALDSVSMKLEAGEAVALLGHNGAGKTTLLKILSRITRPTSGHAVITGRVSTLLSAAAGFHSDLTGRENIFLFGAILGMSGEFMNKHFDAIVSLAGAEKHLDIPVKFYSTGSQLRLAFSVIAHAQWDILLLDEVLSVADEAFRALAVERLKQFTCDGKCILWASHDTQLLSGLCTRSYVLEHGRVIS